jgi:hypothetical protein
VKRLAITLGLVAAVAAVRPGTAAADEVPAAPAGPAHAEVDAAALVAPRRPFSVALGGGVSRDRSPGERDSKQLATFVSALGVGRGLVGGELGVMGSVGRNTDVSRLGFDLLLVLRPLGLLPLAPATWSGRLARGFGLTVGPGVELLERSRANALRVGLALGGYVDVPLTPADLSRELRLRFGGRRFLAGDVQLGEHMVGSSRFELYGAVAVAF